MLRGSNMEAASAGGPITASVISATTRQEAGMGRNGHRLDVMPFTVSLEDKLARPCRRSYASSSQLIVAHLSMKASASYLTEAIKLAGKIQRGHRRYDVVVGGEMLN